MTVTCPLCGATYDDTYRLTYCPHEPFEMRTVVVNSQGEVLGVATSVDHLDRMVASDRDAQRFAASLEALSETDPATHFEEALRQIGGGGEITLTGVDAIGNPLEEVIAPGLVQKTSGGYCLRVNRVADTTPEGSSDGG